MAVNRFVLNGMSFHGHGAINEIPGIVKSKGFKKAFVASDPDLVKFGVTSKVTDLLEKNGIEYVVYSNIKPNPTIENVQEGVDAYKASGAESTINYVITDVEKKRKFVCVDPNDIPDVAVVDPDMMSSMPKGLTASTGMDALTHAIEGYTTKGAWALSDCLDLEAIKLIAKNLRAGQPQRGFPGRFRSHVPQADVKQRDGPFVSKQGGTVL